MVRTSTRASSGSSKATAQAVQNSTTHGSHVGASRRSSRTELQDTLSKSEETSPTKRGTKTEPRDGDLKEENSPAKAAKKEVAQMNVKQNKTSAQKMVKKEMQGAHLKSEKDSGAKKATKNEPSNRIMKQESNSPAKEAVKKEPLKRIVKQEENSPAKKPVKEEPLKRTIKQEKISPLKKPSKKELVHQSIEQENDSPTEELSKQELEGGTKEEVDQVEEMDTKENIDAEEDIDAKIEEPTPAKPTRTSRKRASTTTDAQSSKKLKTETKNVPRSPDPYTSASPPPTKKPTTKDSSAALQAKKLKSLALYSKVSPFPNFPHPTPTEARLAHSILTSLHGPRTRPTEVIASKTSAGCGDSPSVLDALVRTILSQNTSDANSTRAKLSMDRVYGGSDEWAAIVSGGEAKLQEAIKCGGLSVTKSKVIISILRQVHEKYGVYSLDHLHDADTEDAYKEMLAFQGVGPKTASCVLLFCLKRESFAVDTHVWRIAGLLGWRPKEAGREATQAHLDIRIPGEEKYGLHILMVTHGKRCDECKAGGKSVGKCALRKAFQRGKKEEEEGIKGEAGVVMEEEKDKKRRGNGLIGRTARMLEGEGEGEDVDEDDE